MHGTACTAAELLICAIAFHTKKNCKKMVFLRHGSFDGINDKLAQIRRAQKCKYYATTSTFLTVDKGTTFAVV